MSPSLYRSGVAAAMQRALPYILVLTSMASCLGDESSQQPEARSKAFNDVVRPFLRDFCIKCHGDETQKADRRFDQLVGTISDDDALVDFQDVVDQLNLGAMPPEDEQQPTDSQRRSVVNWLTAQIGEYHERRRGTGRDRRQRAPGSV